MEKPRSPAEPESPEQQDPDELTDALAGASVEVVKAITRGKALRPRDTIVGSAGVVIQILLLTMQYPRDVGLIATLANLNLKLTEFLDDIVLNAPEGDRALQALRELAEHQISWPTLVRPRDERFTRSKLAKLGVGSKATVGSLPPYTKRSPSLATGRNRLALRIVELLEKSAGPVLNIKRNSRRGREAACLTLCSLGVPKESHAQFIKLLKRVECIHSAENPLTEWCGVLADYVLLVDPELKQFSELKAVKEGNPLKFVMDRKADLRSRLQRFFNPALKNLFLRRSAARALT